MAKKTTGKKKAAKRAAAKKSGAARKTAKKSGLGLTKKAKSAKTSARPAAKTKSVPVVKQAASKKAPRKKRPGVSRHPRKIEPDHPLVVRLRAVCMELPAVYEKEAWGVPTFRVEDGGMFAMTDVNHHGSGHIAVWVKAPPLAQADLVEQDPGRFFVPPYMGPKGWVGVRLDSRVNWNDVRALLSEGHWMSAPARLKRDLEPPNR